MFGLDFIQIFSVIVFALVTAQGVKVTFEESDKPLSKKWIEFFIGFGLLLPTYGRVWGFW